MSDYVSKDWTVKQLDAFIREATESVNRKLIDYYADTPNPAPQVDQMRERLILLGTGKEQRHGGIAMGLKGKTKAEKFAQARALQEFNQIDIYTPEALAEEEERFKESYETFTQNRPDLELSSAEYKDLVETFGALGDHIINMWGSEEVANLYSEYKQQGEKKKDFLSLIVDVNREAKGQGWTSEDLIDRFREKMQ